MGGCLSLLYVFAFCPCALGRHGRNGFRGIVYPYQFIPYSLLHGISLGESLCIHFLQLLVRLLHAGERLRLRRIGSPALVNAEYLAPPLKKRRHSILDGLPKPLVGFLYLGESFDNTAVSKHVRKRIGYKLLISRVRYLLLAKRIGAFSRKHL